MFDRGLEVGNPWVLRCRLPEKEFWLDLVLISNQPLVCLIRLTHCGIVAWRHESWSTSVQVMAFSLTTPSHCLDHCWPLRSSGNHPREISLQILQPLRFHSNIPWGNELMHIYTKKIGIADPLHYETTWFTTQWASNTGGSHMEFHHHDPV